VLLASSLADKTSQHVPVVAGDGLLARSPSMQGPLPYGTWRTPVQLDAQPMFGVGANKEVDEVWGILEEMKKGCPTETVLFIKQTLHSMYKEITVDGIHRLFEVNMWLRAEVVNACVDALVQHYKRTSPPLCATYTFLDCTTYAYTGGYPRNEAFARVVADADNVLIAVCQDDHFFLMQVNTRACNILVMDSMLPSVAKIKKRINSLSYHKQHALDVLRSYDGVPDGDMSCWTCSIGEPMYEPVDAHLAAYCRSHREFFCVGAKVPQQADSSSCGAYTVAFAECILKGEHVCSVATYDMSWYRKYMGWLLWRSSKHGVFEHFPNVVPYVSPFA